MNQPRDPKLCTREVCTRLARGEAPRHMHPSRVPQAYCSDECQRLARACAYNSTTPALDAWSWLPRRPNEVRVESAP